MASNAPCSQEGIRWPLARRFHRCAATVAATPGRRERRIWASLVPTSEGLTVASGHILGHSDFDGDFDGFMLNRDK
jgi:hypothetical protein